MTRNPCPTNRSAISIATATLLAAASAAVAQAPPSTEIYLATLARAADGSFEVGDPVNVTEREGYDNQPSFHPDGRRLFYTSIRDGEQADIWVYDLETKERSNLTATPEGEYSATPIPGEDAISVVRVEADERQRLWRFPLDGGDPTLILPDVEPVGYHAWSDASSLALFVLGEPVTLQYARRGAGPGKVLAENIGRSLHRIPGGSAVSFVHKEDEKSWTLKSLDLASGTMKELLATRPLREDHGWSPSGELWMGDGSALYVAWPGQAEGWTLAAELEDHKVSEITRLAVHPEGGLVAFVAVPVE